MGSITLILGPMFSGKSTELLRCIRRFEVARKRVVLLKFRADTRYSESAVVSHDKASTMEGLS